MIVPNFSRMRAVQESTFFDLCTIDTSGSSVDDLGDILKTWTSGCVISCGVNFGSGKKRWGEQVVTDEKNVTVRLPIDTVITAEDRITIKSKSGCAMDLQLQVTGLQYGQVLTAVCQKVEV